MYPVRPLSPEVLKSHCGKMVCVVMKDGRRIVGRLKDCNHSCIFVSDERRNQYRSCRAYKSSVLETNNKTETTKKKKKRKPNVKIKGFYPYGYGYGGGWGAGWGWALGLTALALLFLI